MIKPIRTFLTIGALGIMSVSLAACETVLIGGAAGGLIAMQKNGETVNLTEMNYAVADYLAGQTLNVLNKRTPIGLGVLSDAAQPEITSAFGRLVPEQIGTRLSQLGYNVQLEYTDMFEGQKPKALQEPKALLTGTYAKGDKEADVSIRLVNLESGQIIGAFDYVVPLTDEMQQMTTAKPRIIRLEQ